MVQALGNSCLLQNTANIRHSQKFYSIPLTIITEVSLSLTALWNRKFVERDPMEHPTQVLLGTVQCTMYLMLQILQWLSKTRLLWGPQHVFNFQLSMMARFLQLFFQLWHSSSCRNVCFTLHEAANAERASAGSADFSASAAQAQEKTIQS